MAKFEVGKGLDDYLADLQKMEQLTDAMCGRAIYQGAKIVADEVRENIKKIPEAKKSKKNEFLTRGVTEAQRNGLLEGFGIAKKQTSDGFIHVKIGFDGYNETKTEKYPNGQPNSMIARTIESGNSWHQKTPFIAPSCRSAKDRAEGAMQLSIDEDIQQIMR
jgi:hypothetical protein